MNSKKDKWVKDLDELEKLTKFVTETKFRNRIQQIKVDNKQRLINYIGKIFDVEINPDSIFDIQIKRMHEYKRQLLNILHCIALYNDIKENPTADFTPRTIIFAGKAAPGYWMAKQVIKLINSVSNVVNHDPEVGDKLKVLYLTNYSVSMAEVLITAADLSEQISTAGKEASGTGNMKFMINGALTIGTMDGANIEIVEEAGIENAFIFGMTTDEVLDLKPRYNPRGYYERDDEIKEAIDLIANEHFNVSEPGIFTSIVDNLLNVDHYMCLADLRSYIKAQEKVDKLFRDEDDWSRRALLNIANSGKFSSDRTIKEYAKEIWDVHPLPIDHGETFSEPIEDARFKE